VQAAVAAASPAGSAHLLWLRRHQLLRLLLLLLLLEQLSQRHAGLHQHQ
jgi:hypothetical protein